MRRLPLLMLIACTADPTDAPDVVDTDAVDTVDAPVACTPPPLIDVTTIPDDPALASGPDSFVAVFEVDGDTLVGKSLRDPAVGPGAMRLWQELVLRIPTNQRSQLVQFALFESDSLAAYVDNVGTDNLTGRYGPSLFLSTTNLVDDDADSCARLSGHRGTYDWTLIHEFAHLRTYVDGVTDDFIATFGSDGRDGTYPDDGSPALDGDFVSSYAERARGDEDVAESFTAWVMLDTLPEGDTLAARKVRWFDSVPGYPELRQALRVTEPGGGGTPAAAPLASYDLQLSFPDWLVGTWEGTGPDGAVRYDVTADDLVFAWDDGGGWSEQRYSELRDGGALATVEVVESNESFHLLQVATPDASYSETFQLADDGLEVEREHFGFLQLQRVD
jgi:hypothetical protein